MAIIYYGYIQQPDPVSLSGNLKKIIFSSNSMVSFQLKLGDEVLIDESYQPDAAGQVEIDIKEVVEAELSCQFPNSNIFVQDQQVKTFSIHFDDTPELSRELVIIKGGVRKLEQTVEDFLKQHFLTWQPEAKKVRTGIPEWLTYYYTQAASLCVRFYLTDDTTEDVVIHTGQAGQCVTYNTEFSYLWALSSVAPEQRYGYVDLWIKDTDNNTISNIQRYVYNALTNNESYFVFLNSLGGIDTFTMTGGRILAPEIQYDIAEYDLSLKNLPGIPKRLYRQQTGYLTENEGKWIWDFFAAHTRWTEVDGEFCEIVLNNSSINVSDKENLNVMEFSFYPTALSPYLNRPGQTVATDIKYAIAMQSSSKKLAQTVYNLDYERPLPSGFYTLQTAVAAIPVLVRKKGLIIVFQSYHRVSVMYQFNGLMSEFNNLDRWIKLVDTWSLIDAVDYYNLTRNRPLTNEQGDPEYYSMTYDELHPVRFAPLAVPVELRKKGMIITFSPSYEYWESWQFISSEQSDWEDQNIRYWRKLNKSEDIYNITVEKPLPDHRYYTLQYEESELFAPLQVPSHLRKRGLILTFEYAPGAWQSYQFTGGSIVYDWLDPQKWVRYIDEKRLGFQTALLNLTVVNPCPVLDESNPYYTEEPFYTMEDSDSPYYAVSNIPPMYAKKGLMLCFAVSWTEWEIWMNIDWDGFGELAGWKKVFPIEKEQIEEVLKGNIISHTHEFLDQVVMLLAVTADPPEHCFVGDKYFDTVDHLIYTAVENDAWPLEGETPRENRLYCSMEDRTMWYYKNNYTLVPLYHCIDGGGF